MTEELAAVWQQNPTGLIPTGEICPTCARYNARNITCNVMAVVNRKILLVKRAHEPGKDAWAIPGGYVAWNETVLQTAHREFEEETGLTASALFFLGTRSDLTAGDDRQNIDLYFYTNRVSGELKKQLSEVQDLQWYALDALPEPMAFDHGRLLGLFTAAIAQNPQAPIPVML